MTTLATKTYKQEGVQYRLTIEGGLCWRKDNERPYFSLTYTQHRREGVRWVADSSGANHELILEHVFEYADLAALHLSDDAGVPLHAEANGWYWLVGACAFDVPHGIPHDSPNARTPYECLALFARHCRISIDEAQAIAREVNEAAAESLDVAREAWRGICESMRPRWMREATSCIERHNLVPYGDGVRSIV